MRNLFFSSPIWLGLAISLGCLRPLSAATVNSTNEADLRAALAGGGSVTFACDGVITLSNTIEIASDTVLDAAGHQVTLSGNNACRLFEIRTNVSFSLFNLALANGLARGLDATGTNQGYPGQAGAVWVRGGKLSAGSCWFLDHRAVGGKGGDGDYGMFLGPGAGGNAVGGAIYVEAGEAGFTNCIFMRNRVSGGEGGIMQRPAGTPLIAPRGLGNGGAINLNGGVLSLRNCEFQNNSCGGSSPSGGALYLTAGAITAQATTFASNSAAFSGGAVCQAAGTLRLESGVFTGNVLVGPAKGLLSPSVSGNVQGGAISVQGGMASVTNSVFIGNIALGGDGNVIQSPYGERILASGSAWGGAVFNQAQLQIINCTFAYNSAQPGKPFEFDGSMGWGGALASVAGNLNLLNCTIATNHALPNTNWAVFNYGHGGGCYQSNGTISLANTILSGNTANRTNENAAGTLTDGGHNLSSDDTCQFSQPSSRNQIDPMLAALSGEGSSLTLALLPGSPAIDAGDDALSPPMDQRGTARPQGAHSDIGAYEYAFTSLARTTENRIRLTFSAIPGITYKLQASSDLVQWNDQLDGTVGAGGSVQFEVPCDQPALFFRLKQP